LRRLLAIHGIESTDSEILERCQGETTPAALAAHARAHGLMARVVRVQPGELRFLRLPTVLMLKGGESALLLRAGRRRATVQRGGVGWLRDRALVDLEARAQGSALGRTFTRMLGLDFVAAQARALGVLAQTLTSTEAVTGVVTGSLLAPALDGLLGAIAWMAL